MERIDPPAAAGESETLHAFLDYHRATLLSKIEGVSDEDLRWSPVPSGTTLLGLVKHLAYVERWWFQDRFAGREAGTYPWTDGDWDADFRIEPDETTAEIVDLYLREVAQSRAITDGVDLEERAQRARKTAEPATLRWIVAHMIEEMARHNGHADILRELIDGVTGE
ncbi:MAG: DinB family protein [Actinomycetota bacterium]|nr:DinB family protein [Actinomycetota bacterium]